MSPEDAEEYTQALGQVMSGGWRQIALAQRLGVPAALGMETDDWVRERIGGYVRLGLDERREAAKALTDPDGEFKLTQREAAEVLGVGLGTVNRDLTDVPDGTADESPPGEAEDDDVPDGTAEDDHEPICDDCGEPHEDGEPCVETFDYASFLAAHKAEDDAPDGEPELPTMGEILKGAPLEFDDSGLAEAAAQRQRWEYANTVLDQVLELTTRYGPEVLVEYERTDRLPTLARTLDRPIAWLERARQLASEPRTQIRSVT